MAIRQDIGVSPKFFSGNLVTLKFTIKNSDGTTRNLTGVTAIGWILAERQGAASTLLSKTIGSGIASPLDATGVINVTVAQADTLTLDGTKYHELQITDNGPITTTFGEFIIQKNTVP